VATGSTDGDTTHCGADNPAITASLMRLVWKIEPLAGMDDDDIVAAIAPTIQRYLDGDIHPAK